MNGEQIRATLSNALDRWATPHDDPSSGAATAAELKHISAFALATIAAELHEIRLTLQAQHEEAILRAPWQR